MPGLCFMKLGQLKKSTPSLSKTINAISYRINLDSFSSKDKKYIVSKLPLLRNPETKLIRTTIAGKTKTIYLYKNIQNFTLSDTSFSFILKSYEGNYLNPILFIEFLTETRTIHIEKIAVFPDPFSNSFIKEFAE